MMMRGQCGRGLRAASWALAVAALAVLPARAQHFHPFMEPGAVNSPVAKEFRQLLTQLHTLEEDDEPRRTRLREFVATHFDVATMARLALGPQWHRLAAAERTGFVNTFTDRVANQYGTALLGYDDVAAEVMRLRGYGRRASLLVILMSPQGKRELEYKIEFRGEAWVVYDLLVDGESQTKRLRAKLEPLMASGGSRQVDAWLRTTP